MQGRSSYLQFDEEVRWDIGQMNQNELGNSKSTANQQSEHAVYAGEKLGLIEVISMAVGTMIGASIFSIFGVGAQIAGRNLPAAFVLSGLFALLVAYTYAKLGAKIISDAGPIAFILKGIGDNIITGALSILLWVSYVISISLFAKGFAGYFLPLVNIPSTAISVGIVEVVLILIFTGLNVLGSKTVGRAEFVIVLIKLGILSIFILGGFFLLDVNRIIPSGDRSHLQGTLHASIIFFLSYMGFGLVTNASEQMREPEKNVPRAIYISIAIVMFVYISIAVVAVGNLPISQLISSGENALAVAASPFLGRFGFFLISIGALFSISSSLNATLYGGTNVAYSFAKDGMLPHFFERKIWFKSPEGLYITAGLSMTFVLLFNIEEIASITSAIFTIIYIFAFISHFRLADEYGGNKAFIIACALIMVIIFSVLMYFQWQSQRPAFYGIIATILGAVMLEFVYRRVFKRRFLQ
jgi:amino acid transporter